MQRNQTTSTTWIAASCHCPLVLYTDTAPSTERGGWFFWRRLPCSKGGGHLFHLKSRYDGLISPARDQCNNSSTTTDSNGTASLKRSLSSSDESTPSSSRRVRVRTSSTSSASSDDSQVDTTNLDLLADTAVSRGANLDDLDLDDRVKSDLAPAKRVSEQTVAPSRPACAWPTIVSRLSMEDTMKRFSFCRLSKDDCRHAHCRSWAPRRTMADDVV